MNSTCVRTTPELLIAELALRGIQARLNGDQLWLCPLSRVTQNLRDRLREHKAGVIRLLHQAAPDTDEHEAWEERMGICMFDGGLSEEDAEVVAWAQVEDERAMRQAHAAGMRSGKGAGNVCFVTGPPPTTVLSPP